MSKYTRGRSRRFSAGKKGTVMQPLNQSSNSNTIGKESLYGPQKGSRPAGVKPAPNGVERR